MAESFTVDHLIRMQRPFDVQVRRMVRSSPMFSSRSVVRESIGEALSGWCRFREESRASSRVVSGMTVSPVGHRMVAILRSYLIGLNEGKRAFTLSHGMVVKQSS